MSHIAIDIVLRLPQKLEDELIAVNHKNFDAGKTDVKFGKKDYIPHISLFMGVIDEEDIGNIAKRIQIISEDYNPLQFWITKEENNALSLKKSKRLLELQQRIEEEIAHYCIVTDVVDEHFVRTDQENIPDRHKAWVQDFATEHSGEFFEPHITTYANIPHGIDVNKKFITTTLGLYQLGYSCTCRKELFLAQLLKRDDKHSPLIQSKNIWDILSDYSPFVFDGIFVLSYAWFVTEFKILFTSHNPIIALIVPAAFILLTICVYLINTLEQFNKKEIPNLFGYPAIGFGLVLMMMALDILGISSGNSVVSDTTGLWITLGLLSLLVFYLVLLFLKLEKKILRSTRKYFIAHTTSLFISTLLITFAGAYWEFKFVGSTEEILSLGQQIGKTILLTPLFLLFFASPRFLYLQKQFTWYSLLTALAAIIFAVWHSVGTILL